MINSEVKITSKAFHKCWHTVPLSSFSRVPVMSLLGNHILFALLGTGYAGNEAQLTLKVESYEKSFRSVSIMYLVFWVL